MTAKFNFEFTLRILLILRATGGWGMVAENAITNEGVRGRLRIKTDWFAKKSNVIYLRMRLASTADFDLKLTPKLDPKL